MQASLPPYAQAVVAAARAFVVAGLSIVKTDTAATFLAKCQQAGCAETVAQANITWQLRCGDFSAGPGFFSAQRLENFLIDMRIFNTLHLLPH